MAPAVHIRAAATRRPRNASVRFIQGLSPRDAVPAPAVLRVAAPASATSSACSTSTISTAWPIAGMVARRRERRPSSASAAMPASRARRRAECAIVVADGWQGRGLGHRTDAQLAAAARDRGIDVPRGQHAGREPADRGLGPAVRIQRPHRAEFGRPRQGDARPAVPARLIRRSGPLPALSGPRQAARSTVGRRAARTRERRCNDRNGPLAARRRQP